MFKLASLGLGFLTIVNVAPLAQAATFQNRSMLQVNGELHAQKLVKIKNSSRLNTSVIENTPTQVTTRKKIELSPADKKAQRMKNGCERELNANRGYGDNERQVRIGDDPDKSKMSNPFNNINNFGNSTQARDCSYGIEF